ncbi:MAG: hypothetical protein FJX56_07875 [Alphaproteobacteria bacterium]|nr:hypothetical protein [Alphaproteobacteria bacterium]
MPAIRTVLGDIPARDAGVTLTHEHTLIFWPGAEFDHRAAFDWNEVMTGLAAEFREGAASFGLRTLVDCTTVEMGRHPKLLCEASERGGVNVVAATGFFCESMGIPYHWRRQSVAELAEFLERDVTEGIVGTRVRCGIIKVSSGQDDAHPHPSPLFANGRHIGIYEERVFRAAGRAQKRIGVPITTHSDPEDWRAYNIGLEQLDLLMEEGADPAKVIIGHCFYASFDKLEAILRRGAAIQLDNIGTGWRGLDDDYAAGLVRQAVDKGYGGQIVLTFDRFWYQMRGERPFTELDPEVAVRMPVSFLPERFLPLMRRHGIDDAAIRRIMVDNPARILAFA